MGRKYRILLIKACGLSSEDDECNGIINFCKLLGFDHHVIKPKSLDELYEQIKINGEFDFIYFSAHGNEHGFANDNGTISDSWNNFSYQLCESGCLATDCMILLSCCRGGLREVASKLFFACEQISYIIGVKQSLYPHEMVAGFTIFLFNVTARSLDPVIASSKIEMATDLRFIGFDYKETVETQEYKEFTKSIFDKNDYVALNSGSPIMKVKSINSNGDETTCTLTNSKGIETTEKFQTKLLRRMNEGDKVKLKNKEFPITVKEIDYLTDEFECIWIKKEKIKTKKYQIEELEWEWNTCA